MGAVSAAALVWSSALEAECDATDDNIEGPFYKAGAPERTAASYSANCLKCHQVSACKVAKEIGPAAASNCIDCHMPVEPTTMIVSETAGKETRAEMRNHWIKV